MINYAGNCMLSNMLNLFSVEFALIFYVSHKIVNFDRKEDKLFLDPFPKLNLKHCTNPNLCPIPKLWKKRTSNTFIYAMSK